MGAGRKKGERTEMSQEGGVGKKECSEGKRRKKRKGGGTSLRERVCEDGRREGRMGYDPR